MRRSSLTRCLQQHNVFMRLDVSLRALNMQHALTDVLGSKRSESYRQNISRRRHGCAARDEEQGIAEKHMDISSRLFSLV